MADPASFRAGTEVLLRSFWSGRQIYHFLYGENTVRILPCLNALAFTEKILALLKDEKNRNEMSNAARERAMKYDWTEIARRMDAVYHTILQND